MARYNVVIPLEAGGVEVYPLMKWLRQHPDILPGFDFGSQNTHAARDALRRKGWRSEESPTEVRLIKPGTDSGSQIVGEVLGPNDDEGDAGGSPSFYLERQLQDFIVSNLPTIKLNGKRLKLYVDPTTGRDGVEFETGVGPIDLLAIDDSGSFYVFELKRANSPDRAIGQVARYMGRVGETIGKGREVFGVIVAKSISENLRYAASIVPKVYLYENEVTFDLKPAHHLTDRPTT
jgi:endonuclease